MCTGSPKPCWVDRRTSTASVSSVGLFGFAVLVLLSTVALAQAPPSATPTPQANGSAVSQNAESTAPTSTLPGKGEDKNLPEITTHQETETTFKVNVNLVLVRVVVRDGQGHAIGTLKKEDFQLFDSGKPQTIARFAVEKTEVPPPAGNAAGKEQIAAATETPERYVAYLFDDLHLPFSDVARTRNAAMKHLDSLSPGDRAAVYTTSGIVMQDFTDDRAKLRATLLRINPNPIRSTPTTDCPYITPYQANLIVNVHDPMALQVAVSDYINCMNMNVQTNMAQSVIVSAAERVVSASSDQSRIALGTIRDVVNRIAQMPGPRTIVLVSPGFLLIDNTRPESEVIDRAVRSNVVISTLDARGLYTSDDITRRNQSEQTVAILSQYAHQSATDEANVLSELAYGTGGTYFHNNNDLIEGFRRTAAMPEYYYVLGFAPQNLKNDGKYHNLKVTLANKQPYALQARKGYYAPTHLQNAAEQAKSDINDAVFSQEERKDMPVELHTKYFKTSDEGAKLAVLVKVDVRHLHYQKVDGRYRNALTIVSALFDRNGNFVQGDQKTLEMRLTDDTLDKKLDAGVTMRANFDVKSGSYLVRCVVRDTEGQLSAVSDSVEIP
ncbi:MAG TPA: VWA domain-containing protein [Terriglobales bacterium]